MELCYSSNENKGADQLCSYCEADLRLCFRIGKKSSFLMTRLKYHIRALHVHSNWLQTGYCFLFVQPLKTDLMQVFTELPTKVSD